MSAFASRFLAALGTLFLLQGCAFPATPPTTTFRLGERMATCTPESLGDPRGPAWTDEGRRALADAHGAPVVASVLGCRVEVRPRCRASTTSNLARDLDGDCDDATHLARAAGDRVALEPLSLGDYRVTGVYAGVMRQPHGPYEAYDATLYLAQDGDRVNGVTRLSTKDGAYYGDLRFDGTLRGNVLFFSDTDDLDDNLPFYLGWCGKSGYLVVDPKRGRLEGPWVARGCAPGTLDLERTQAPPTVIIPPSLDRAR